VFFPRQDISDIQTKLHMLIRFVEFIAVRVLCWDNSFRFCVRQMPLLLELLLELLLHVLNMM
jgi:hypothetical protein